MLRWQALQVCHLKIVKSAVNFLSILGVEFTFLVFDSDSYFEYLLFCSSFVVSMWSLA